MSSGEKGETLSFHDIGKEEAHGLAHVENDMRKQAGQLMAKAAFAKKPDSVIEQAKQLLANQNERDYEWLADQAKIREVIPKIPIESDPGMWLRIHYQRTGVTNREIAKKLGISEGHLSAFVKGNKECPEELQKKLVRIFSELPTKS